VNGDGGADCAEQLLYGAAARWGVGAESGPAEVIGAACQALIDGLDSPTLRDLAGASVTDRRSEVGDLVARTLEELGIPYPGTVPAGCVVAAGGGVVGRAGVDSLRLEVTAPAEAGGVFEVLVFVNGVEMTSRGAGLGMDPYDILVPSNRLLAAPETRTVPIARCECGEYGCGSTDVTITRDGDVVHWEWLIEAPMGRGVSFAAAQYDAEVARVAADHSWETPERTAGRLVLTNMDRDLLLNHGLRPMWAANSYRDHGVFRVSLQLGSDYQIFVHTPWRNRSPEELADEVCATLARPPRKWRATWHAMKPTLAGPPTIAGWSWRRAQF
jgi:hypothetical protein